MPLRPAGGSSSSRPDVWIGVYGAGQTAGSLFGFRLARRVAWQHGGLAVLLAALLAGALVPAALSMLHEFIAVAALAIFAGVSAARVNIALFDELLQRIPAPYGVTFASIHHTVQTSRSSWFRWPNESSRQRLALPQRSSWQTLCLTPAASCSKMTVGQMVARYFER